MRQRHPKDWTTDGVLWLSRNVSNLAAGRLTDPVDDREPLPPWDVQPGGTVLVTGVQIVDVDRGVVRPETNVFVEGSRIAELVTADDLPAARSRRPVDREIDGTGFHLIPGLSDLHCHVSLVSEFGVGLRQMRYLDRQRLHNSEEALKRGCTFVRDCGGAVGPLGLIRTEIEAVLLKGPRIMTATTPITPRGGMWDVGRVMGKLAEPLFGGRMLHFPSDEAEIVAAMTQIAAQGADFFKTYFEERPLYGGKEDDVYTVFTPAQARTIRDTADRFGKQVSAHTMFMSGSRRAIEAGIDVLDHCTVDEPYSEDDAHAMAEQGTAIVPTLSVGSYLAMDFAGGGHPDDPEVRFFIAARNDAGRAAAARVAVPELRANYERFFDWLDEPQADRKMPMIGRVWPERCHGFAVHAPTSIGRLREAGAKVGVGTDGGTGITFCGHLDTELKALHRYGYSRAEVVRMATLGNMEIVGRAGELGSIEAGKLADFVLVDGNPLDDLDALDRVALVVVGGRPCHDERMVLDRPPSTAHRPSTATSSPSGAG